MPLRTLGFKTPIQCLKGSTDYVVTPRVFGCVCFAREYRPIVGKLDPQALKCVFVGYPTTQKGYKCYYPSERRMLVTMDVTFRKTEAYYESRSSDNRTPELLLPDDSLCTPGYSGAQGEYHSNDVQGESGIEIVEESSVHSPTVQVPLLLEASSPELESSNGNIISATPFLILIFLLQNQKVLAQLFLVLVTVMI